MKKKRGLQKEVLSFLERARHRAPKLSWHLKCATQGFPTTVSSQLSSGHSLTHSGFLFSLSLPVSHTHWHAPEFVLLELSIQKQRQQQQLCVQWLLMKLVARPFICATSTTQWQLKATVHQAGESVSSEALSWTILLFLLLLFLLLW